MLQLNFHPFPERRTEKLLLRRMKGTDAAELFFLRSDPRVMQYIGREPAKSEEEVIEFIETINKNIDANETIMWAIALKEEPHRLIGNITLWQINKDHSRAELGYLLHPDHWRKGIMREAIRAVIEYGFEVMKLHSIEAKVDSGNSGSALLLENVGFSKEGYFKEDFFFRGKYYDTMVYSLLNHNE